LNGQSISPFQTSTKKEKHRGKAKGKENMLVTFEIGYLEREAKGMD